MILLFTSSVTLFTAVNAVKLSYNKSILTCQASCVKYRQYVAIKQSFTLLASCILVTIKIITHFVFNLNSTSEWKNLSR